MTDDRMDGQIDAAQYDANVRAYLALARAIQVEAPDGAITDEDLADELHEWLNAPDSLLQTWSNDGEDLVRAQCVANLSQHPDRVMPPVAPADPAEAPEPEALADAQYLAAHLFVRDVLWRLGRTYRMPADLAAR
jgi:hypothetical protein